MLIARQPIVKPDPPREDDRSLSGRFQKKLADDWSGIRERFGSTFGGRSTGWWLGGVVGFGLFVFVSAQLKIDVRNLALVGVLAGGAVGNWMWTRVRESLAQDRSSAVLYQVVLAIGIVTFVASIFPEYRENLFGAGGGYVWSTRSRVLAGVGAALVLLGILNRGGTKS